MFCTNCGAQCPDGSQFCDKCGTPLEAVTQPSLPEDQPVQQTPYAPGVSGQPVYGQQFVPQMPAKVRVPLDPKKKKLMIVVGACAAVLAVFLIILFAAIIPNSGAKGKLRHRWQYMDYWGDVAVMDLKKKHMISDDEMLVISDWRVQGNHLFITVDKRTEDFYFTMTRDGKYLVLFENGSRNSLMGIDDPEEVLDSLDSRPDLVFVRAD